MNVQETLNYFNYTPKQLATTLNVTVQSVYVWVSNDFIPFKKQIIIENLSNGFLKTSIPGEMSKEKPNKELVRAELTYQTLSRRFKAIQEDLKETELSLKLSEDLIARLKKESK
jgi:hypothetical protein